MELREIRRRFATIIFWTDVQKNEIAGARSKILLCRRTIGPVSASNCSILCAVSSLPNVGDLLFRARLNRLFRIQTLPPWTVEYLPVLTVLLLDLLHCLPQGFKP